MFSIKELRERILFTLMMLAVYRLAGSIWAPGIDISKVSEMFTGMNRNLFDMMDMFTGGGLGNMTIMALGVMPNISASIIIQLAASVVPSLERLSREGEAGRRKINQYTRYLTVIICVVQGGILARSLCANGVNLMSPALFIPLFIICLTAGTTFLMWLGEQITQRGVGNGISLIIAAGILCRMPYAFKRLWQLHFAPGSDGSMVIGILMIVLFVVVVYAIIMVIQGQRRIPVQYARRVAGGGKTVPAHTSYIPLRLNQANVIPIIFAGALMIIPQMLPQIIPAEWYKLRSIANFFAIQSNAGYLIVYAILVIFFTYFYTAIQFNPVQIADDFKKNGAFIPGIRPGKPTADFLEASMFRITTAGAIFLAVIAVVPALITGKLHVDWTIASFMGGTGILIVVGVVLDTMQQIEAHLLMHQYDGFMQKGRLRGRY
jgi:preprotein translocase subunit SecY